MGSETRLGLGLGPPLYQPLLLDDWIQLYFGCRELSLLNEKDVNNSQELEAKIHEGPVEVSAEQCA